MRKVLGIVLTQSHDFLCVHHHPRTQNAYGPYKHKMKMISMFCMILYDHHTFQQSQPSNLSNGKFNCCISISTFPSHKRCGTIGAFNMLYTNLQFSGPITHAWCGSKKKEYGRYFHLHLDVIQKIMKGAFTHLPLPHVHSLLYTNLDGIFLMTSSVTNPPFWQRSTNRSSTV